MPSSLKRDLRAWWLIPSFSRVQFNDMDMVLYTGVHKPRQEGTKHMPEVVNDPDAFLPKIDISVYTFYNQGESFPIYAREAASLVAGIKILDVLNDTGGPSIIDRALALVRMWIDGRNDLTGSPYIEFDPNRTTFENVVNISTRYGPPMVKYTIGGP